MRNIILRYDDRTSGFLVQYPKTENFKDQVLSAVRERNPLPKISEVLEGGEDLLRFFPELEGLSNLFQEGEPDSLVIRINRESGVVNTTGKREDGSDIDITSSVIYANNSGTYESFDGTELESVKFVVSKQNVENITPFFSTTMNVTGVDGNGTITELSFGSLQPGFASPIFTGNLMGGVDVTPDYVMGSQPIIWSKEMGEIPGASGGDDGDDGRLKPTPIDFEITEPYEGEYYIQNGDVLVKLDVVNNTNVENVEGLKLTINNIFFGMGVSVEATIDGDYSGVIPNQQTNGFYVKDRKTQELLFFGIDAAFSVEFDGKPASLNFGKTIFNVSLFAQVIPFQQGDEIFITFNTAEGYSGTPSLETISITSNAFEIDGYEIINGGTGYIVGEPKPMDVKISNGFQENIVVENLTNGTWSIPQQEIVEGFFYDIVFDSGEVSFSGRFKRVGNRLSSVDRVESNLIFSAKRVFDQPIMAAGSFNSLGPAYITDSVIQRPSIIRRPNSFLLEKVILTRSRNTVIVPKSEYEESIYVDNFNREINVVNMQVALQLALNPEDCLDCIMQVNQVMNFSQTAIAELQSEVRFVNEALTVESQDNSIATYDLRIVGPDLQST